MYTDHFGITESPFSIAPDPRYLYMSSGHQEAFAHLLYGVRGEGGFVLLTGEVGTGKTTVCRCLLEQCPPDTNIAFILNPRLTALELLAAICDELGIDYSPGTASGKELVDRLNRFLLQANANARETVLIIDEAQNLDAGVLEQVRLLTNLETNSRKLLRIIMLGQPELQQLLARPELRQLSQRITARYHLGALRKSEIAPYLAHRLSVAGITGKVFSPACIRRLYPLSRGIPRVINILCDRAMLGAFVEGREIVNRTTLEQAAREVFGTAVQRRWLTLAGYGLGAVILAVVFGVVLGGVYDRYLERGMGPVSPVQTFAARPSPAPGLKLATRLQQTPADLKPDTPGTAAPAADQSGPDAGPASP